MQSTAHTFVQALRRCKGSIIYHHQKVSRRRQKSSLVSPYFFVHFLRDTSEFNFIETMAETKKTENESEEVYVDRKYAETTHISLDEKELTRSNPPSMHR